MQLKRDITGGIMSVGVITTSIFAIMHSNMTEVNMNEVTIVENGERITITTEADTVQTLVTDGYVQLGNFDDFTFELEDVVYDGMELEIIRAFPVTINDGGTRFQVMTTESEVIDVLDEHNIALGEDDLLEVRLTRTNAIGEEVTFNPVRLGDGIGGDLEVEVTRVAFETVVDYETITLDTQYIYTDEFHEGETVIGSEGTPRVEETIKELEYRNGEFFGIVSEETHVTDEGAAKVVFVGTYVYVPAPPPPPPVVINTTTPEASIEAFTASVTAYNIHCNGCSGFTANGTDVRNVSSFNDATFGNVRIIAADRRFPFGSIIYISGIGNAVVLDRGGSVTGNVLDLLLGTYADPWQFGRQSLQAQVVRLGW